MYARVSVCVCIYTHAKIKLNILYYKIIIKKKKKYLNLNTFINILSLISKLSFTIHTNTSRF